MLMFLLMIGTLVALAVIPRYRAHQECWRLRQHLRELPSGKTFLF